MTNPMYPYADTYGVLDQMPARGLDPSEIVDQLRTIATKEDARWEGGQCSGTMYAGDHDHYGLINETYGLFSHVNALQRDMCPSMTRFESEIIAMTLDVLNASAVSDDPRSSDRPCGVIGSGGTESICNAILAYRNLGRAKGITAPQMILPDTGAR